MIQIWQELQHVNSEERLESLGFPEWKKWRSVILKKKLVKSQIRQTKQPMWTFSRWQAPTVCCSRSLDSNAYDTYSHEKQWELHLMHMHSTPFLGWQLNKREEKLFRWDDWNSCSGRGDKRDRMLNFSQVLHLFSLQRLMENMEVLQTANLLQRQNLDTKSDC